MFKSMIFAIAITITLAVAGAGQVARAGGEGTRLESTVAADCCPFFFMGRWWCLPC
jgi:hypothetical protein